MALLNANYAGTQITDEHLIDVGSSSFQFEHDTYIGSTLLIYTGTSGSGTLLVEGTDYTIGGKDLRLSGADYVNDNVYTIIQVTNPTYQSGDLYASYKSPGDYTDGYDAVPSGMMAPFAGVSVPTGWLLCDGSAVSRTTYSALFSAIGTTWGIGDDSTTFNLPDMRESAPVGAGTYSAVAGTTHDDTDSIISHDARALGEFADDQIQGHLHGNYSGDGSGAGSYELGRNPTNSYTLNSTSPITDGTNGTPRTGTVTRGKTIGVNFIIKT